MAEVAEVEAEVEVERGSGGDPLTTSVRAPPVRRAPPLLVP